MSAAPPTDKPHNIILIVADDLGWRDINCHSNPDCPGETESQASTKCICPDQTFKWDNAKHTTPNLRRLADKGVRFSNAYAACPFCKATRASLLTGKHPMRLGLTAPMAGPGMSLSETTIAEALKEQDSRYACGAFGKWHVAAVAADMDYNGRSSSTNNNYYNSQLYPEHQGFDNHDLAVNPNNNKWINSEKPDIVEAGDNNYINGYDHDFYFVNQARDFITRTVQDHPHPFFVYLEFLSVHQSSQTGKVGRKYVKMVYDEYVHKLDINVGRVLRFLDSNNREEGGIQHVDWDNTYVLFYSDNGAAMNNAPLRDEKLTVYEGGIRVPLIVAGPNVAEKQHCKEPISSIDFFPTVLQMAFTERYDPERDYLMDGKSFLRCLDNDQDNDRIKREQGGIIFCEGYDYYSNGEHESGLVAREYEARFAIRGNGIYDNYKLLRSWDRKTNAFSYELYDLLTDQGETINLYNKQVHHPISAYLKEKLQDWFRLHIRPFNPSKIGDPKTFTGHNDTGYYEHEYSDGMIRLHAIQNAVNDAENGDTIILPAATLYPAISPFHSDWRRFGNLTIDKSITLISRNPYDPLITAATILDGNRHGPNDKGKDIPDGQTIKIVPNRNNQKIEVHLIGLTITGGRCVEVKDTALDGMGIHGSGANAQSTIKQCLINNNMTLFGNGGAIYNFPGTIAECIFYDNRAGGNGGALADIHGIIRDSAIMHNAADGNGGAIANSSAHLLNCTIMNNRTQGRGGALWWSIATSPTIRNCIFWNNAEIRKPETSHTEHFFAGPANPIISYCCIQNSISNTIYYAGIGNLLKNPTLVDGVGMNYHLLPGSPCIDAGDPDSTQTNRLDIDRQPRIMGKHIDIGADEWAEGCISQPLPYQRRPSDF